jgi:hypothetical protein
MGTEDGTQAMADDSLAAPAGRTRAAHLAITAGWWLATLVTLIILDDLTFGPIFWLISRLGSPLAGFAVAMAIYMPVQIFLVWAATSGDPGRIATFFLQRLDLERRSRSIAAREHAVHERVTGAVTAIALSPVIGGVLPPMVLWRMGFETTFVRRLSIVTAFVYALEFSLLHGVLPGTL